MLEHWNAGAGLSQDPAVGVGRCILLKFSHCLSWFLEAWNLLKRNSWDEDRQVATIPAEYFLSFRRFLQDILCPGEFLQGSGPPCDYVFGDSVWAGIHDLALAPVTCLQVWVVCIRSVGSERITGVQCASCHCVSAFLAVFLCLPESDHHLFQRCLHN